MWTLLWTLRFSRFSAAYQRQARELGGSGQQGKGPARVFGFGFGLYIYADDVEYVLTHRDPEALVRIAGTCAGLVEKDLGDLGLQLGPPKCNNMVLSPGAMVGGVFRRANGLAASVNRELPKRDRRMRALLPTMTEADLPEGIFPPSFRTRLPFNFGEQIRLLGLIIDDGLTQEKQVDSVMRRVLVRQGVMAQLAKRKWGLEVGILRSTHATLITSLISYGLVAVGSTAYEGLLDRLEAQYTNIVARRIVGVDKTARLEVLHMVAGVMTVRNKYLQHCGLMVDRTLRGHNGVAQQEMQEWVNAKYGMKDWNTAEEAVDQEELLMPRVGG